MPNGDDTLVYAGSKRTIRYARRTTGAMLAKEFVEGLDEGDQRKLMNLFQRMGEEGLIFNKEKFRRVEDKLYEFKSFQIRIGCFQVSTTWFLTHGFIKKKDKWSRSEIDRGLTIMAECN
jgi:hypothetical protein